MPDPSSRANVIAKAGQPLNCCVFPCRDSLHVFNCWLRMVESFIFCCFRLSLMFYVSMISRVCAANPEVLKLETTRCGGCFQVTTAGCSSLRTLRLGMTFACLDGSCHDDPIMSFPWFSFVCLKSGIANACKCTLFPGTSSWFVIIVIHDYCGHQKNSGISNFETNWYTLIIIHRRYLAKSNIVPPFIHKFYNISIHVKTPHDFIHSLCSSMLVILIYGNNM